MLKKIREYLMNKVRYFILLSKYMLIHRPEQEEWLTELREKAVVLDRRIHRQVRVYTAISCLL